MRRWTAITLAVLALGALSGGAAYERAAPRAGDWQEIAWPFPRDGWPAGRAFRCGGGACGGVEVYVRPKKGFCNCDTGVADDDEVDRVADLDLMSERFAAREAGHVIRVADMPGRLRAYDLDMQDGSRRAADRHRGVAAVRSAGRGRARQGLAPPRSGARRWNISAPAT